LKGHDLAHARRLSFSNLVELLSATAPARPRSMPPEALEALDEAALSFFHSAAGA